MLLYNWNTHIYTSGLHFLRNYIHLTSYLNYNFSKNGLTLTHFPVSLIESDCSISGRGWPLNVLLQADQQESWFPGNLLPFFMSEIPHRYLQVSYGIVSAAGVACSCRLWDTQEPFHMYSITLCHFSPSVFLLKFHQDISSFGNSLKKIYCQPPWWNLPPWYGSFSALQVVNGCFLFFFFVLSLTLRLKTFTW